MRARARVCVLGGVCVCVCSVWSLFAVCILAAAAVQKMFPAPPVSCIGIDLGTTFSCVAVFEDGEISVINNRAGVSITPSILHVPEDDGTEVVVGTSPAKLSTASLYDAKRFIGKRYVLDVTTMNHALPFDVVPFMSKLRTQLEPRLYLRVQGQPLSFAPEDVGTLIVYDLKLSAEEYAGREVRNTVLAVPVGFNALQINATRQSAAAAGFNVLRTIHEPTAAAMAYGLHTRAHVHTVLVYDIGGGTLDVSLLNLNNGIFEVMAASGDNRLGGQDFNMLLLEYLIAQVSAQSPGIRLSDNEEAMRILRDEVERVKVELNEEVDCSGQFDEGSTHEVQVELPEWLQIALNASGPIVVSRTDFEELATPLFSRALTPVRTVLEGVGIAPSAVDELVLVGGSSRMARIRAMLRDFFGGRDPNCDVSPEEAVAHGTAIQAAILTNRKKISVGASEAVLRA